MYSIGGYKKRKRSTSATRRSRHGGKHHLKYKKGGGGPDPFYLASLLSGNTITQDRFTDWLLFDAHKGKNSMHSAAAFLLFNKNMTPMQKYVLATHWGGHKGSPWVLAALLAHGDKSKVDHPDTVKIVDNAAGVSNKWDPADWTPNGDPAYRNCGVWDKTANTYVLNKTLHPDDQVKCQQGAEQFFSSLATKTKISGGRRRRKSKKSKKSKKRSSYRKRRH